MAKSPDAFRTISEVATWLDRPAHVLRFWESKFTQVKPVKRAGGRRYYRRQDMLLLGGIKKLLHDDGMTIKGVQKLLREHGVKHVTAMSQPLDGEAHIVDEAPMIEAIPDPVEETGGDNLLSFPAAAADTKAKPKDSKPAKPPAADPAQISLFDLGDAPVAPAEPTSAEEIPAAAKAAADTPVEPAKEAEADAPDAPKTPSVLHRLLASEATIAADQQEAARSLLQQLKGRSAALTEGMKKG